MASEKATYSHGHHTSVVSDHARRTAADSAAYLIPLIRSTDTILDVGCGPGTISADFAALVEEGQGSVIGCDASEAVVQQATELVKSRNLSNLTFQQCDANALPFADNSFDIVHCHQVLQHVKDPVGILKEMRRVARPGGIVAAREADFGAFAWYPEPPEIAAGLQLYQRVARANGGEPRAGRFCHVWATQAGFASQNISTTWGSWRHEGLRAQQFSESWSGRMLQPGFLQTAVREGFADEEEVRRISDAWKQWGSAPLAFFAIPNGEIICYKEDSDF